MQTLLDLIPATKDGRFTPEPPGSTFFLGLDLGLRQDHSALAIIERAVLPTGDKNPVTWQHTTRVELRLRHISRWPLGTPYHQITNDLTARIAKQPLANNCILAVDATGVGDPIVESIKAARPATHRIIPVVITGPGHAHWLNSRLIVPRQDLIANLQLHIEQRRLRAASGTKHAHVLQSELTNFGQAGEHDDLVLATALAAYLIPKGARP